MLTNSRFDETQAPGDCVDWALESTHRKHSICEGPGHTGTHELQKVTVFSFHVISE